MFKRFDHLWDTLEYDLLDPLYRNAIAEDFVEKCEDCYKLHVDVPGVKKEDVKLELKDDVLHVIAERKGTIKNKLHRSYRLGKMFDTDNLSAEHTDGVLVVTLPLKIAKNTTKNIQIK